MAKIYDNILELVGHTPLVRFHALEEKFGAAGNIIGKLEFLQAGFSSKSRIAKEMVEQAEKSGALKKGGTIIEGTSGNTGIGLAMVAAQKGYKSIITMPENMSKERIAILKSYGSEVVLTPADKSMGGSGEKVQELAGKIKDAFVPGQGRNENNPGAHFKTTGPEIWEDTDGKVDILVAAVGTGGTLSGTGKYLKEKNPHIKIVAVQPTVTDQTIIGVHNFTDVPEDRIPANLDRSLVDEIFTVLPAQAFWGARLAAKNEGLLVGTSSGAALYAAVQVAKRRENKGKNIAVILVDTGLRYLSTELFEA